MSLAGVVARKGAPVTFTHATPGTYDPATDRITGGSVETVTGVAMQIEGNPEQYAALGLIQSENPTLLFKPTTVGQMPVLGSTVVWGADTLTVKDVEPEAMNGTAKSARVRCSR